MSYTREQILNMPVGREIDAIAARLSGYTSLTTQLNSDGSYGFIPRYSTNISDAMTLLDYFIQKGAEVNVGFCERWDCSIDYPIGCNWHMEADSAAEAITKAALLTFMESGGTGNE